METIYVRRVLNRMDVSSRQAEEAVNELKQLSDSARDEQADPQREESITEIDNRLSSLAASLRLVNSLKTQAGEVLREYERLEEESLEAVKNLLLE